MQPVWNPVIIVLVNWSSQQIINEITETGTSCPTSCRCRVKDFTSVVSVDVRVFLGKFELVSVSGHQSFKGMSDDGKDEGAGESRFQRNSVGPQREVLGGFV